jgi:hypothetical protein
LNSKEHYEEAEMMEYDIYQTNFQNGYHHHHHQHQTEENDEQPQGVRCQTQ